ncbi:hypothetical protein [Vallitalea guaymasensis]|uniref:hypothetical protein n=1 Tax=Vallitalea guaymasensis TaxID=1185412 RepID=UPI000DE33FA0|nr:hypothetical protein [Vallitalea guaymasensis]
MNIIAINNHDGTIETININNKEGLAVLYNERDNYSFKCGCNNTTHMKLSMRNDSCFASSMQGEKSTHQISCPFYGNTHKSLKGYQLDEKTGELCFSVSIKRCHTDISLQNDEEINDLIRRNDQTKINHYFCNRGVKKNKLTFHAFVTKMLLDGWNSYYSKLFYDKTKGKSTQLSIDGFIRYFFGKSNKYRYNKSIVNEALAGKIDKFNFTMGVLTHVCEGKAKTMMEFHYINHWGKDIKRNIKKRLWFQAVGNTRTSSEYSLVFFKSNLDNKFKTITDIAIVPINKYGLVVESSYEERFYNHLIEKGILFEKPYEIVGVDYPYVPDAIIKNNSFKIEKSNSRYFNNECIKTIIFELFGVENNKDYEQLKLLKKKIGDNLNKDSKIFSFSSLDVSDIDDVDNYFH